MKGIIKGINMVFSFGVIMAMMLIASSIFPYIQINAAAPNYLAVYDDDISIASLEDEYNTYQATETREIQLADELYDYVILTDEGLLELYIPGDVIVNVSQQEIDDLINHFEDINQLVLLDEATVNDRFEIQLANFDDEYYVQATSAAYLKFSITWTGKYYLKLGQIWSAVFGLIGIGMDLSNLAGGMTNIQHYIGATYTNRTAQIIYASAQAGVTGMNYLGIPDLVYQIFSTSYDIIFKALVGMGPWGWVIYVINVVYKYFIGDLIAGFIMLFNPILHGCGTTIYRSSWLGTKSYSRLY